MNKEKSQFRTPVRLGLLTLLGLGFAAGIFFVWQNPPTDDSYYPKCTLHQHTGLHCPGCGLTRSVWISLHGDFEQALAYNILAPILIPILGYGILRGIGSNLFPARATVEPKTSNRFWRWFPAVLAGLLVVFGILRNIPVYPLTLLAPHELTP